MNIVIFNFNIFKTTSLSFVTLHSPNDHQTDGADMVLLNDTLRDLNWNKSEDADLAKRKGLSTFTEPSSFSRLTNLTSSRVRMGVPESQLSAKLSPISYHLNFWPFLMIT